MEKSNNTSNLNAKKGLNLNWEFHSSSTGRDTKTSLRRKKNKSLGEIQSRNFDF